MPTEYGFVLPDPAVDWASEEELQQNGGRGIPFDEAIRRIKAKLKRQKPDSSSHESTQLNLPQTES
jgi:hypothetical protein